MIVLVSAAALRTSGARTIYRQFIAHLKTRVDGNRYYIMVGRDMEMPEIMGVEYLVVDVSSKIKRLMFDAFGLQRILSNHQIRPDVVVSLQNIGLRKYKQMPQIIYYHNALPFFDYKWCLLKKKEYMMFLYKHLYPYFVKRTIGIKTEMVAQLPFIKKGIVAKYGVSPKQVHVMFPDLDDINIADVEVGGYDEVKAVDFVFPATYMPYKGHEFLVSVMEKLYDVNRALAEQVRIHLTLYETTSQALIKRMEAKGVRANFVFHGVVNHARLLSMYKGARGLLFPSVIETLGLPLIEAAKFGLPVVACDLEYAHEVLAGYSGTTYVDSRSTAQWAEAIIKIASEHNTFAPLYAPERSSWEDFFDLIENKKVKR